MSVFPGPEVAGARREAGAVGGARLVIALLLLGAALACNAPLPGIPEHAPSLTPIVTLTPVSVSTPTSTPTATPSPTPTPTSTPTPTPTPEPEQLLSEASRAMEYGDYEAAAARYHNLLSMPLDRDSEGQARFGLGHACLRDRNFGCAVDAFRALIARSTDVPADRFASAARFLLAEALMGQGEALAAAEAYRAYLAGGTVITAYVSERLGDALYAGGAYTEALSAYTYAIAVAPDRSTEVGAREKLALVYVALGDYPAAVAQYEAILNVAQIRAYRARIEHQLAETLLLAGDSEAGYARHLNVVRSYPEEHYAYLSLVKLVEAGRPPDDFLRGVVDYYGGAYGPAVEAFSRYVNAYPETHSGDAHWYAGMSYLKAGSPALAIEEFRLLIDTHPENERRGDAWMGLAEAYLNMDDLSTAVASYRQFAELMPHHPRAAEALWKAAQSLERAGELEAAAQAYLDCHTRYPQSDYAPAALFRSGLQSYRLNEWTGAAVAWDTLANLYPDSAYRPAALMWLGKVRLLQGDDQAAREYFNQAAASAPQGYYGLRAAELATALTTTLPIFTSAHYDPPPEAADRPEAEAWLAAWLGVENTGRLGELQPILATDPRLQRGVELWQLGLFEAAKWELEALRNATRQDALAQYQLALLFRELGLYRSSILCAARVISLASASGLSEVPAFIQRLAYPNYYEALVLDNARQSNLDPLLIFALIRQESLFESLATSSASARGLMQVIPPTGAEIHAALDWPPGYETADLYRPYVSLRFGTYYLARQLDRFGGRVDVALAAYNGGPSNARRWLDAAGDDPDLFVELITLEESRLY
ncbi:MAG: transglycosylase SLT domain-containing protein, partial [Anaerolineae bacterium]|nr:transglycosylase SLT domain-containing protein [Anaerolineae bacterium]